MRSCSRFEDELDELEDELDIPAEELFIEILTVNGTEMQFEMDSGCGVTVMYHSVYKTLWGERHQNYSHEE